MMNPKNVFLVSNKTAKKEKYYLLLKVWDGSEILSIGARLFCLFATESTCHFLSQWQGSNLGSWDYELSVLPSCHRGTPMI